MDGSAVRPNPSARERAFDGPNRNHNWRKQLSGTATNTRGGKHTPRTPAELRAAHVAKMAAKAGRRDQMHTARNDPKHLRRVRAAVGGHTPHQSDREMARRVRQMERAK